MSGEYGDEPSADVESSGAKLSLIGGAVGTALGSRKGRAGAVVGGLVGGTVGYLAGAVTGTGGEDIAESDDPVVVSVDDVTGDDDSDESADDEN